ncbi:MAG: hypothetical protein H6815_08860 [Phycisphaeraceae bacterium]|nr:hypothetical protein [Phycisphaerales bacterium]MCB9860553.1 hypothetical protein [Phycisphaeraceae bacterium]
MRTLASLVTVAIVCAVASGQSSTSNLQTESQLRDAEANAVDTRVIVPDVHADRTVQVIASQTSHGYEGWVIPSTVPSVWIDTGEGPGCVQSISVRISDARSQLRAIQTLSALSLIIETDTYQAACVRLIDLVPGRGDVFGSWPVTYDNDTMMLNLTLKMQYRFLMRVGFILHGESAVGLSATVVTSEEDSVPGYVRLVDLSHVDHQTGAERGIVIYGTGQLLGMQLQSSSVLDQLQCLADDALVSLHAGQPIDFDVQIALQLDRYTLNTASETLRGVAIVRVDSLESDL